MPVVCALDLLLSLHCGCAQLREFVSVSVHLTMKIAFSQKKSPLLNWLMNFQLLDVWAWNSITSCASISIIWLLGWTIQVEIPFCDNYAICSTQTVVYYFLWCWSSSRIRWIFSFWLAGVVKRLLRWLGLLRFYLKIAHQLKFKTCFAIGWNSCSKSKFL